ncbi:MAG TPA: hypothetical protein VH853_14830 [Polyangia bacterium]|nr:hypothetical protein [Polyangia bacterium]
MALGLGGCAASQTTARVHAADLRGSTRVSTPAPRFLVAGPVELLHVNVDKKAGARFIRVPNREGAMPDCGSGAPLAWDGESDLYVQSGESVCVAVVHDARVSWHARHMSIPAGFQRASLR